MTTTTTTPTARQIFLQDVLIGAVEGGTGYWAQASGYVWSDEHPETCRVTLHPEDDAAVTVTPDVIRRGLREVRSGAVPMGETLRRTIITADRTNDGGEIDAEGADVIVQVGLYGAIVYG